MSCMKRPVESSNGCGVKCVTAGWQNGDSVKKTKRTGFFPISEQSVMCETKRCPTPQGEEDGVSASRWQATEEVELELEAVQSAWCRCPRWPGAAEGRSGMIWCPEVVWFGCESVVRGSRSRERDLSLPLNRWMSGGVLVGDGVAGLR